MELMIEQQKEVVKTELGSFPKDWQLVSIKEIAKINTGDKNTEDKISDGKYPFFVRSANVERINSYSFDGEAVLTAGDGVGTGKIFHYINGKFDYHQRVYKMSDFSSKVNGYYFYLCFRKYFYERVMGMTAKSSVDSVRMEMIADMEIPLPTLAEQQAIATALSDVDELIRSFDALIQKKEAIKKGSMQQLLTGKKRLPGFDGEWEVKALGEVTSLITKGTTPTSLGRDYKDRGIRFIKAESVNQSGNVNHEKTAYIDKETNQLLKRSILQNDDIVFSIAGVLGRTGIIKDLDLPANTNQALAIIRLAVDSDINLEYLFHYLRSEVIKKYIDDINVQAAQANLSLKDVGNLPINTPPIRKEQEAIAQILSDMDNELQTLRRKREKMARVKEGMMQELLTGKVRLI